MERVYYSKDLGNLLLKLREELAEAFSGCKKIAIKIHFGEPGNKFAFTPKQIKPVTDLLKELGIEYFLYDSSVMYGGKRGKVDSHKKYAIKKGWGELGEIRTDEGFIIAKGEKMNHEICKPLIDADGVLVLSHFKGHTFSGFGGAVKNLGMGALTKKTKADIHNGGKPDIVGECTKCNACEIACPVNSIKVTDKPKIAGKCGGCSNCIYACKFDVLKPKLDFFDKLLAEGASLAQSSFKKVFYVSFLINITEKCDCYKNPREVIAKDCGYLASKDGVAIDKAGYDIIVKNHGDVFKEHNKKSGLEHIEYAEKFGMGSQEYELVEIDI